MPLRFLVVLLVAVGLVPACDAPRQPLNSERIQERYGSYGVEILFADAGRRVSSLYSEDAASAKTCRTLAVVEFTLPVDSRLLAEHERIVSGHSIGQVFVDAGWKIDKQNLLIGESLVADHGFGLDERMQVPAQSTLATHRYRFVVEREGDRIVYATITEVHHPDYLDPAQLRSLYE